MSDVPYVHTMQHVRTAGVGVPAQDGGHADGLHSDAEGDAGQDARQAVQVAGAVGRLVLACGVMLLMHSGSSSSSQAHSAHCAGGWFKYLIIVVQISDHRDHNRGYER